MNLPQLLLVGLAAAPLPQGSASEPWQVAPVGTLVAGFGAYGDRFGSEVAMGPGRVLIGAPRQDVLGADDAGKVHSYLRTPNGWIKEFGFQAGDPGEDAEFGAALSMWSNKVVVGAPGADNLCNFCSDGSAYVFKNPGGVWNQTKRLTASDAAVGDRFGSSVAMEGDTIIVGAPRKDTAASSAGGVYAFDKIVGVWTEQARLEASDAEAGDLFGSAVALSGDTLLVGAPYEDEAGTNAGAVYVFQRSAGLWAEVQKLTPGQASITKLGLEIDFDGTRFAALSRDAVHVFDQGPQGWFESAVLSVEGGKPLSSVDLDGPFMAVGRKEDGTQAPSAGSFYLFVDGPEGWREEAKVIPPQASQSSNVGAAVGLLAGELVVGAIESNGPGSAYTYTVEATPAETYCTAGVSASGCSALIGASGTPSATAASGFTLTVDQVEGQKRGLFFFGANGRQANPWGATSSYQCVVPPVARSPLLQAVGTAGQCDAAYAYDLNAHWAQAPGQNPGLGARVQAQFWYRDPFSGAAPQTSMSAAVEFTVGP